MTQAAEKGTTDKRSNYSVDQTVDRLSPEYLQQRHGLPKDLLANIEVVEAFALKAAE